ncbi:hypothetical protein GCM10022397_16210 [Flavivirga jejuensis]
MVLKLKVHCFSDYNCILIVRFVTLYYVCVEKGVILKYEKTYKILIIRIWVYGNISNRKKLSIARNFK